MVFYFLAGNDRDTTMIRPSRRQAIRQLLLLLSTLQFHTSESKNEWNDCPPCDCSKWSYGKKHAACNNKSLEDIPALNEEIQSLFLEDNRIHVLKNDVFIDKKLVNLQVLKIRDNNIDTIEKNAFRNLGIIIEIDLSYNQITRIDPTTFRPTVKLRSLNLNRNKIQKIENELFKDLPLLNKIDMSDNQISHIGPKAFINVPKLRELKLSGNLLTQIKLSMFEDVPSLNTLELMDNPWNCDCHMRNFVTWYKEKNLLTLPTTCNQPGFLKDRQWKSIEDSSFACKPEIVSLVTRLDEDNERLLLYCKVRGDPSPETHVMFNARILNNNTLVQANGERK